MSDSYSYDQDVTSPLDTEDPLDLMIKDLIDYGMNTCSVSELLQMAASWLAQDLESKTAAEIQQMHTGLFSREEVH